MAMLAWVHGNKDKKVSDFMSDFTPREATKAQDPQELLRMFNQDANIRNAIVGHNPPISFKGAVREEPPKLFSLGFQGPQG